MRTRRVIHELLQQCVRRPAARLSYTTTLTRMRWVSLVMITLADLSQILTALAMPTAARPASQLVVVALLWLVVSMFWLQRRGRPHPALDVADCCALFMLGLQTHSNLVAATAFPTVFFTSTYGSRRRLILRTGGFLFAFVGALMLSGGFDARVLPGYVTTMVSLASILHVLKVSLKRNDRSLAHQRILASAGHRLVAAQTPKEVYAAAIESAHEFLDNDPLISAALLLPSGQELVVAAARGSQAGVLVGRRFPASSIDSSSRSNRIPSQMSPFTDVLLAPLVLGGDLVGAIALASPSSIPTDTEEALRALAAETVLAIEGAGLIGQLASRVEELSREIAERERAEKALEYQAFHDALSELPNRALFLRRLDQSRSRPARQGSTRAVLFLDLDNFKLVNDSLGHAAGDHLLVAVARRLEGCVRNGETIARLGGDEFTILIEELASPGEAVGVARRIAESLLAPIAIEGRQLVVTASIGIALDLTLHPSTDDLLRAADVALYVAKSRGKACYVVYDPTMDTPGLERLEIENESNRAKVAA